MKRESRTVDRPDQVDSPFQRHLPLVDLLVDTRAELLELAVSSGLKVLTTMLEEDRTAICGPRYQHQADRTAFRAGTVPSEVVLGGRKVAIRRPRVRRDGGEVALPTFQLMASEDPLNRRIVEQMLVGVATRQYARSLEPLPAAMTTTRHEQERGQPALRCQDARPAGSVAVATTRRPGPGRPDSRRCARLEHCLLVALGIAADGQKHALGLWEGSTENATLCQSLLANLQSRGLRTDRSLLVILDGSKALRKAVRDLFGDVALVQRCQVHKLRNILDHLPERQRTWAKAILQRAYRNGDVATARRLLVDLARRLESEHPSAAESVREGLDETLTVLALNLPDTLRRSLTTTNAAESLISRTRHVKRNVKRWRGGQMVVRWVAAGVLEAVKGFRRLKGYKAMPQLVAALRARDQQFGLVDRESIGEVA
jgi:putative transposase